MPTRRDFSLLLATGALAGCASRGALPSSNAAPSAADSALNFDINRYVTKQYTVDGKSITVRAFEGLPVVTRPVEPEYQQINVYIPEAYFRGEAIGPYTAQTAPIFLPNQIGGYMPAQPGQPDRGMGPPPMPGAPVQTSAMAVALSRGFVVASPGARGRTLRSADGIWTGKAPAAIVDLKASVRWLRHNAGRMPGNVDRIVSNGTSAGGALSALLGASGNNPDYEVELKAIGAAAQRDDIFAVSAYCPITNLEHADAAYEWQFRGIAEYRNIAISMLDFKVERKETVAQLNASQLALSKVMAADFANYVNQTGLSAPNGRLLQLDADGQGTLQEHLKSLVVESANQAIASGQNVSDRAWLRFEGARVVDLDFPAYVRAIGRQKGQPAFDGFALETGENQLFGDAQTDLKHFTDFSMQFGTVAGATRADPRIVRLMNAMEQLASASTTPAKHWRIRHGTQDRDTSLAIPALLAAAVRRRGLIADLAFPWDRPHSGDYDLDALFAWIDQRVAAG